MELRGAINSLLTRAVQPKSAEDMRARHEFCEKLEIGDNLYGLTYGNRCKCAGQTHLQRSKRNKVLVKARLARKELTAISLRVLQILKRLGERMSLAWV